MSGLGLTTADLDDLAALYQDLHRHPELSFQETRTAGLVAKRLRGLQFEVTEGVGRTGVVGLLRNGAGPTVLLRADMDALPVEERTDLPYASKVHTVDAQGTEVAVMHACGHDLHVTCLLGACVELARRRSTWSGTVMAVFQPAEEVGGGARAMIDDDLFGRFGSPVVVLGQHVTPLPAGVLGLRSGPAFAAADSIRITLHGRGAHGSRPETSVDPVVMAAAVIMRLQTVVSRDVAATDTAVVTVGAVHAGTAGNIIPDRAQLLVTVRTFRPEVRTRILASIERIVRAEAAASGADRTPDIELMESFPALVNDDAAAARTRPALESVGARVVDPGLVAGSEDVGVLATAAGVPCVYWLLGGADPAQFVGADSADEIAERMQSIPSNHSPRYAPVVQPTLTTGIAALVAAAQAWLAPGTDG